MNKAKNHKNSKTMTDKTANILDSESRNYFIRATISGVLGVVFVVFCVIFGLERGEANVVSITWAIAMLAACVFRVYHVKKLYPSPNACEKSISKWILQLHVYTIICGLLWVTLPLFKPSVMGTITGAYTVILLGILTGGVYSLNRFMWGYFFYTMPIAGFLIWHHSHTGDMEGQILAFLIAAFCIAAMTYARNTSEIYSQSFKLRTVNLDLIDKLKRQAADLKIQKNKAESANNEKSKFLAAASHDLRQPLHALGFYLSALENHVIEEKGNEILGKSEKSLNSLNDLLNALIGISQLDAGDVDISPEHFNLHEICTPLIEEMEVIADRKNISLTLDKTNDIVVFCDQVLLTRSMRNIIINAIKHAECNDVIISAGESKYESNSVDITITDNGKGIPESDKDIIFDEFHQLNNEEKDRRKGLGLGLAIVKRIADLQGHKIKVISEGKGCTFSLSVPIGNEMYSTPLNDPRNTNDQNIDLTNSILVIDDEIDVLDGVALTLRSWQQNVACATNSHSALLEIKNGFSPNIIISDYNLAGKETGTNAIEKLSSSLDETTQIVFVTGDVSRDKVREIRETGHPVLPKPLKPQMLKNLIKQLNKKPDLGRIS